MALFGANKFGGHHRANKFGGDHGLRPVIPGKHSVVEYSERSSSESYMHEQFVAFGRFPPMMDHEHSPPRHELFDHPMGGGNNPFSRFWNDWPGKVDEFSPEHRNAVVNWRRKGPPTNKVYREHHFMPRYCGKCDHFNSSDSDNDDDIICNDGVSIRNTKGGANTKNRIDPYNRKPPYGDNNENHRGNVKFAPPYSGPFTTQPRKDPPYETYYVDKNEKPKGNGYSPPRYSGPSESQPRKAAYSGPSNDSPRLIGLPPIKTRSDTDRLSQSANNSPVAIAGQQEGFSSSPETIDSAEARRRYAKVSPRAEVYRKETHTGVIDSRQAARKYNGVFVP